VLTAKGSEPESLISVAAMFALNVASSPCVAAARCFIRPQVMEAFERSVERNRDLLERLAK
jgi:hypothetical protein